MTQYNIYFGTIGKTLGVKYRFTKWCKNENAAKRLAEAAATSFYYKNEGKYGIPSYIQIDKESKITGIDVEKLYKEHIKDMMRYFVVPTYEDTVSTSDLKF